MARPLADARAVWWCAFAAATLASGCGLSLTDGGLTCSTDGRCPPGYHCALDDTCWRNGRDPRVDDDLGVGDDLGDDMQVPGDGDITPTLTDGQLCADKRDCISGFCADGVCCDTACTESCKSCNRPSTLGACVPIDNGASPAHGTCGPDAPASCGRDGLCDGSGACRKYDVTTVCAAASCSPATNLATPTSKCDGAGHCQTPTPIACDPYVCNGTTGCFTSCSGTAQCKGGMPCNSMQCGPKTNGSTCALDGECGSGNCVDGVCCNTPKSSCSGCHACNLASSLGTCANVPTGNDPHGACATNDATCTAGGCNGAGACKPSANTVTCSSMCGAVNQLTITKCNGVSLGCTNSPTTMACASNLVCRDATTCAPNCTAHGDADCVSGFFCSGGNCVATLADGTACTAGSQCRTGVCGSYHRDADGDGFGAVAVARLCGSSPPAGFVNDGTDCCDADGNVHPGQAQWFASAASGACGAGFFDYNCDGATEHQLAGDGSCVTVGACNLTEGLSCQETPGWIAGDPGCGNSGQFINSCRNAPSCTPCQDPGSCGAGCASASIGTLQQACH
ncbi:MAG: hypothetical protein ACXVDD_05235 [Polyangia bacterium]